MVQAVELARLVSSHLRQKFIQVITLQNQIERAETKFAEESGHHFAVREDREKGEEVESGLYHPHESKGDANWYGRRSKGRNWAAAIFQKTYSSSVRGNSVR